MKKLITICFLTITVIAGAQKKLDITIIGTAHYFADEHQSLQSFEEVQNFIIDLDPDIICIEAIPTTDTLSLKEILPNTMKRADRLRDTLQHSQSWAETNDTIIDGALYYASYDVWNGYYKWFLARTSNDSLGYFQQYHKNLNNSEYGLIVFPAAEKLGTEKLYGIDFRDGEGEFLAYNKKVLKKLLFGLKWKPLGLYLKAGKKTRKSEKEGRLIEYVNSEEFQSTFSPIIDNLPNWLPKSEEAKAIKEYWLKRNRIMAERIVQTATEEGAQKILLTVGSAHVTHIKRFLEADGHQVTTYGEVLKNTNQ